MKNNTQIKIAIFGMDQRSLKMTKLIFKEKLTGVNITTNVENADVILLDMDTSNHAEHLETIRSEYNSTPMIVLSIKSQNVKGAVYLRKPLSLSSLSRTLDILALKASSSVADLQVANTQVEELKMVANSGIQSKATVAASLDKHESSSEKAIKNNVVTLGSSDDISFDPERFAIWKVKKAVDQARSANEMLKINLWSNKTIIIIPDRDEVITDLSDGTIRSIGVVAADKKENKIEITKVDKETIGELTASADEDYHTLKIDSFLWQLAAATARGRTPSQLFNENMFVVDQPVYISKWPNITRLTAFPNSLRIIAFIIKQPATQSQVCKLLSVDRADFNNIIFACAAIDIAGQAVRHSDSLFAVDEKPQHKSRSLFGSILSHLRSKAS